MRGRESETSCSTTCRVWLGSASARAANSDWRQSLQLSLVRSLSGIMPTDTHPISSVTPASSPPLSFALSPPLVDAEPDDEQDQQEVVGLLRGDKVELSSEDKLLAQPDSTAAGNALGRAHGGPGGGVLRVSGSFLREMITQVSTACVRSHPHYTDYYRRHSPCLCCL